MAATGLPFDELVSRVIRQESGGNPNARNPRTGAAGIMQVMPATAAQPGFGVAPLPADKLFDPQANRAFGEAYLQAMLDRYGGDQARALAAYNWGPGNADRWDGRMSTLPSETQNYLVSILGGGYVPPEPQPLPGPRNAPQQQPDFINALAQATMMHQPQQASAAVAPPQPPAMPHMPMLPPPEEKPAAPMLPAPNTDNPRPRPRPEAFMDISSLLGELEAAGRRMREVPRR